MARLVTSGRAALAAALKTRPIHFAWGRGEAWWNTRAELIATFAGAPQQIALPHAPVAAVVVSPAADPAAPYQTPEDYIWDAKTGVITRVIGGAIASGAAVKITVDYGRPVPPVDGTALLAEVGRRQAKSIEFVTLDPAGEIMTPDKLRWSISPTPTRHLCVHARFDFADASDETIREMAVFIDTIPHESVPAAKPYLLPEEVADRGIAFLVDHLEPTVRSAASRPGYTYVITL